jgi:hypothetical protein
MTRPLKSSIQRWPRYILLMLCVSTYAWNLPCAQQASAPHHFGMQDNHFVLNGIPFRIISGEMHYARIPRSYWRDRLKMAKAMGLNSITTYVFWNLHEPRPGVYDLTGQNNIAEFIREAQQEGLYVILRPGPYVCAEWEWGAIRRGCSSSMASSCAAPIRSSCSR